MLQHASKATDGVVASQAARALGMFVQARDAGDLSFCGGTFKVAIPYFGTVAFGPGKEFGKKPATQTPSIYSQPTGLPTPEDSSSGSLSAATPSTADPFVSFDSYLAQMPFNVKTGESMMQQPSTDFNTYSDAFTNVDLDLDQDWYVLSGPSLPHSSCLYSSEPALQVISMNENVIQVIA